MLFYGFLFCLMVIPGYAVVNRNGVTILSGKNMTQECVNEVKSRGSGSLCNAFVDCCETKCANSDSYEEHCSTTEDRLDRSTMCVCGPPKKTEESGQDFTQRCSDRSRNDPDQCASFTECCESKCADSTSYESKCSMANHELDATTKCVCGPPKPTAASDNDFTDQCSNEATRNGPATCSSFISCCLTKCANFAYSETRCAVSNGQLQASSLCSCGTPKRPRETGTNYTNQCTSEAKNNLVKNPDLCNSFTECCETKCSNSDNYDAKCVLEGGQFDIANCLCGPPKRAQPTGKNVTALCIDRSKMRRNNELCSWFTSCCDSECKNSASYDTKCSLIDNQVASSTTCICGPPKRPQPTGKNFTTFCVDDAESRKDPDLCSSFASCCESQCANSANYDSQCSTIDHQVGPATKCICGPSKHSDEETDPITSKCITDASQGTKPGPDPCAVFTHCCETNCDPGSYHGVECLGGGSQLNTASMKCMCGDESGHHGAAGTVMIGNVIMVLGTVVLTFLG